MDEYISADPAKFDHHDLFKALITSTLQLRLNDATCSMVGLEWYGVLRSMVTSGVVWSDTECYGLVLDHWNCLELYVFYKD